MGSNGFHPSPSLLPASSVNKSVTALPLPGGFLGGSAGPLLLLCELTELTVGLRRGNGGAGLSASLSSILIPDFCVSSFSPFSCDGGAVRLDGFAGFGGGSFRETLDTVDACDAVLDPMDGLSGRGAVAKLA